MKYLENLNDQQIEAVKSKEGATLLFAGAGTGKTTTIIARVFHLIKSGVSPKNILLMTFTNKASKEMLSRIEKSGVPSLPFVGTFHKFGNKFLLKHIDSFKERNSNFRIIEYSEIKQIIKELLKSRGAEKIFSPDEIINLISKMKNSNIYFDEKDKIITPNINKELFIELYRDYEMVMKKSNFIDLDDLQLLTYRILQKSFDIRNRYSNQYQYIMIDEFQDTNRVQYEIIKLLLTSHNNIFVVGDDDQSIYGWRGAEVENILKFEKEFRAKSLILNRNYRSSKPIIETANSLISYNNFRKEKSMISHRGDGLKEAVKYFELEDDEVEAEFVVKEISKLLKNGVEESEIAVLYRINSLSQNLEKHLLQNRIKYQIKGKSSFYSRLEIKEIITYLNAIVYPHNDMIFINALKETYGVGTQTINRLIEIQNGISLFETIKQENLSFYFKTRARYLITLVEKIEALSVEMENFVESFEELFDIRKKYSKYEAKSETKEDREKYKERVQNIDNFYSNMKRFLSENGNLLEFLNLHKIDENEDEKESITLLSIHLSKGLEFQHVFIIGMNDGYLPHYNSFESEEERRLAYVAFTRAKDRLYLTSSKYRTVFGKKQKSEPSRYLFEAEVLKGKLQIQKKSEKYKLEDYVIHKKFGVGAIKGVSKVGSETYLEIEFFGDHSVRKLTSSVIERLN
jgi:DNA helicase-2/ATP-dependent DNA helicase PcrA